MPSKNIITVRPRDNEFNAVQFISGLSTSETIISILPEGSQIYATASPGKFRIELKNSEWSRFVNLGEWIVISKDKDPESLKILSKDQFKNLFIREENTIRYEL